jgi:hypothetical protein
MLSVVTGFIDELREAGVPVSMVEAIDALKAVEAIDIGQRTALRETLRATLVKNLRHERAFDTAFDVYFSTVPLPADDEEQTSPDPADGGEGPGGQGGSGGGEFDESALFEALRDALAGMDEETLRRMVREAVDRLAGMEPGRPVGGPTTCTERSAVSTWPGSRPSCSKLSPVTKSCRNSIGASSVRKWRRDGASSHRRAGRDPSQAGGRSGTGGGGQDPPSSPHRGYRPDACHQQPTSLKWRQRSDP